MFDFRMNRRQLMGNAAAVSALAALGIKPSQVLGAEGGVLKARMEVDIQVLDPGYMIGGTETSVQFACLPRLAVPVRRCLRPVGLGAVRLCREDHRG